MNTRSFSLLAVGLLALGLSALPSAGQTDAFIITNADATNYFGLVNTPDIHLDLVPRFVVQYANAMHYYALPPVNSELVDILQQVPPKFTLQYANANKYYPLTYPVALVNDTAPPQISGLSVRKVGGNVVISWNTDELATRILRWGTTSGSLTNEASEAQFKKTHLVTLSGLANGTKYYYNIQHVDRSGNIFQSAEFGFTIQAVYLPFMRR